LGAYSCLAGFSRREKCANTGKPQKSATCLKFRKKNGRVGETAWDDDRELVNKKKQGGEKVYQQKGKKEKRNENGGKS